jgi:predicted nucleotidyltransferase
MKAPKILSHEEIRERMAPLFEEEGLKLVLLFGSAASGKLHARSDIDVAFLFDKPVDILGLTNRVIRLLRTDNVDVIDLRRASPLLKFSAAREGELLYERSPGLFHEFVSFAFRRYVDTRKLRDARQKAIKGFLAEKGFS